MGNRILKESICTSASVNDLTWFEEVFFYRLIVNCDDYGRFDARPAILRSLMFPLKDITIKQVDAALSSLVTAGMVRVYEYDRQPFLQLENWTKHQTVRNKRSKYPSPDDCKQLNTIEINCNQLNTDECNCSSHARNPIQSVSISESESESESESISETREAGAVAPCRDLFAEFWAIYPKKTGRGAAEKAWKRSKVGVELHTQILQAVEFWRGSDQWQREGGQYIPNPARWLSERRWEDERPTQTQTVDPRIAALEAMKGREDE